MVVQRSASFQSSVLGWLGAFRKRVQSWGCSRTQLVQGMWEPGEVYRDAKATQRLPSVDKRVAISRLFSCSAY